MTGWKPDAVGGENGVPALLFHGTKKEHVAAIRRNGLIPRDPHYWCRQSGEHADAECAGSYEPEAVYLTDSLHQACANSDYPINLACILVVDAAGLPLLCLAFYACMQPIPAERITSIADHPALRRHLHRETGW